MIDHAGRRISFPREGGGGMVGFLEVVGNSGGFNIYTGISSLE